MASHCAARRLDAGVNHVQAVNWDRREGENIMPHANDIHDLIG